MDLDFAKKRLLDYGPHCIKNIDEDNQYIRSYPYLLKATACLCSNSNDTALVAVAHMAYGWMPTVLKKLDFQFSSNVDPEEIRSVSSFFDAREFVSQLDTSPVNISWVGLSKTLHFINPEWFPIWDSKVAKHFKVSGVHQMKKRKNYLDYINFVECHSNWKVVLKVQQEFKNIAKYGVTRARACEFILFSANP